MGERCIKCGKYLSRKGQYFCSSRCRYKYNNSGDLIILVKEKWFEMMLHGIKKDKYLEIKPYWTKRFANYFSRYYNTDHITDSDGVVREYIWSSQRQTVIFRNGSRKNAPEFTAECTLSEGFGKPEWGAEADKRYYIITVHRIFYIKNCDTEKDKRFSDPAIQ